MIATFPAVQHGCSHAHRYVCIQARTMRELKRIANRRHRRYLNAATRRMQADPESFYDEPFSAPTLTTWDLW